MTELNDLASALEEYARRGREDKLSRYTPYSKQAEFHALGATKKERALIAGNRVGKSFSAAMETALHLTGLYDKLPFEWKGRCFDKPVRMWVAGKTSQATRDVPQAMLLGMPGQHGTGAIPKDCILDVRNARGIADAVDTIIVQHSSGGKSYVTFKTYDQGREPWQGTKLDALWFDEEPPPDIYSEGYTRTADTGGIVYCTFTPLLGPSEIYHRYTSETAPDRAWVNMTLWDAQHFTEEERKQIIAAWPSHERETRSRGVPMLGKGRVWPYAEDAFAIEGFEIPDYWAVIDGIDFGIDHPFAWVRLAWDRDADKIYVVDCFKVSDQTPILHAGSIRARGLAAIAWPHDGHTRDKGSGSPLAAQYKAQGLLMLGNHATWPDGSSSVEAGISEIAQRIETGRFKVFKHLTEWFDEYRMYHRKDGMLVKERDDLLSATRYALMMKREARPIAKFKRRRGPIKVVGVDFDVLKMR